MMSNRQSSYQNPSGQWPPLLLSTTASCMFGWQVVSRSVGVNWRKRSCHAHRWDVFGAPKNKEQLARAARAGCPTPPESLGRSQK